MSVVQTVKRHGLAIIAIPVLASALSIARSSVAQDAATKPDEAKRSAAGGTAGSSETPEELSVRVTKGVGVDFAVTPGWLESRRAVLAQVPIWYGPRVTYIVAQAIASDKAGGRPADQRGALALEILATDGRYSIISHLEYDREIIVRLHETLGIPLSKELAKRRSDLGWGRRIGFRLAAVTNSAQGPIPAEVEEYKSVFGEGGYNSGRRRGDPYFFFVPLSICEVSPLLVTVNERDFKKLTIPAGRQVSSFVLLSDKDDETLLSMSKPTAPQPRSLVWHLKRVEAVRDADGRPSVEIEFDDVAAAGMARLTEANPGRRLAVLFGDHVVQFQVIDRPIREKMSISGKAFDEKLVSAIVSTLQECMVPDPSAK